MTQKQTDHPYLQAWQEREITLEKARNSIADRLSCMPTIAIGPGMTAADAMRKANEMSAKLAEIYGRLQNELMGPLLDTVMEQMASTGRAAMLFDDQGDISIIDDDVDRCCSECGDHFDGSPDDDYCGNCWDKLYPELNFIEDEE